jgi:hypothetical protein
MDLLRSNLLGRFGRYNIPSDAISDAVALKNQRVGFHVKIDWERDVF